MDSRFYQTEQDKFWAGEFGDIYTARNRGENLVASNVSFFSNVLLRTEPIESCIEFGANIGLNIVALRTLLPNTEFSAIEINDNAVEELRLLNNVKIYHQSLLDFNVDYARDLVLIKGVLIHMNPEKLPVVYDLLYKTSKKYICLAEYYNPSPTQVSYRGFSEKLFKRDFAGEMLDKFSNLNLVDYGFVYHRDRLFPQDDITWFLLQKMS